MVFQNIFLSSPSACQTSGASKNRDWPDKMGWFIKLHRTPYFGVLEVPCIPMVCIPFLTNFYFLMNFLTNSLTRFFDEFFDKFFDELFWRIFWWIFRPKILWKLRALGLEYLRSCSCRKPMIHTYVFIYCSINSFDNLHFQLWIILLLELNNILEVIY